MSAVSPQIVLAFFLFAFGSGLAGLYAVRCVTWAEGARLAGVPLAVGIGIGPLLTGVLGVVALGALPGAPGWMHLLLVAAGLGLCMLLGAWRAQTPWSQLGLRTKAYPGRYALNAFVGLWFVALLASAVLLPLTQNDSLEYATVGRLLFESRDLGSYPAIHPEQTSSGFYGPWTHPPLYVALIYLSQLIQGHADTPGLMRLISPWCIAAATGLVFALGRMVSAVCGVVAALLFISTPLLFLGAGTALIDALPILGLGLALAVLLGVQSVWPVRAAATGVVLGLALWTHSQAVLFIPLILGGLVALHGYRAWRQCGPEAVLMVAVACLVAAWPYARNVALFGTLISDNPAVFAMPELRWDEYFRYARGLDNWGAVVQYGIFKGWFAVEAYSWAFWLMGLGALLYLRQLGIKGIGRALVRGVDLTERGGAVLWVCLGLIVVYLGGVVASVVLGLDLMIKNERYLLVIMSPVAILAAFGCSRMLDSGWRGRPWAGRFAWGAFVMVLSLQAIAMTVFRYSANYFPARQPNEPIERMLTGRPEYRTVAYLREVVQPGGKILSFKPADMYYSGRKMLSYLDPVMLPIYRTVDPVEAAQRLAALGVTHVQLPDYALPVVYNSVVQKLLRRIDLTTLVFAADGNQVYALKDAGLTAVESLDISPAKMAWSRSVGLLIGGRKALLGVPFSVENHQAEQVAGKNRGPSVFHRDWSTILSTSAATPANGDASGCTRYLPIAGAHHEYALDLGLRGHGMVRIWILQYGVAGPLRGDFARSQHRVLLGEIVLDGRDGSQLFSRRIRPLAGSCGLQLQVEHVGASIAHIDRAMLSAYRSRTP